MAKARAEDGARVSLRTLKRRLFCLLVLLVLGGGSARAAASSTEPASPNLLSVQFQLDLVLVSGSDLCSRAILESGNVTCVESGGAHYQGDPLPGEGGHVDRAFVPGSGRLLLGFERLLAGRFGLGGRIGYGFGGGPTAPGGSRFLPLYLEARAVYWIVRPASGALLLPFVTGLGGVAQAEARVRLSVTERAPPSAGATADATLDRRVDAWTRAGFGFAGIAAGLLLPLYRGSGPTLQLKLLTFFPTPGVVIAPELGYAVQF